MPASKMPWSSMSESFKKRLVLLPARDPKPLASETLHKKADHLVPEMIRRISSARSELIWREHKGDTHLAEESCTLARQRPATAKIGFGQNDHCRTGSAHSVVSQNNCSAFQPRPKVQCQTTIHRHGVVRILEDAWHDQPQDDGTSQTLITTFSIITFNRSRQWQCWDFWVARNNYTMPVSAESSQTVGSFVSGRQRQQPEGSLLCSGFSRLPLWLVCAAKTRARAKTSTTGQTVRRAAVATVVFSTNTLITASAQ